jgi:hypothetical protein
VARHAPLLSCKAVDEGGVAVVTVGGKTAVVAAV